MTLSRLWTVVSTNWLREQIGSQSHKAAGNKLRILDTSYISDPSVDTYRDYYLQGHIPQSVFFDMHKCVTRTPELPRNLPDMNCFTEYAQDLGIGQDTHVITYDRFGPMPAFRTWWLFRLYGHRKVSVLDGGLRKWLNDGHEVTTEVPEVEKSDFVARLDKSLLRNHDDMLDNYESKREQVVDARALDEASVCDEEANGGVIPGSTHVSFYSMFKEDGTIKSDRELKELFDKAGVDLGRPVVATCFLGISACGVAAAAHILGKETVPVYYGAYNEWRMRVPEEMITRVKKS